ncbi:hypothetical protein EG830_01210 [bacterium]|nr:hypothetical protein [bacterium]
MKNLQKFTLVIVLFTVTLFSFGQSRDDVLSVLGKAETRQMVMDTIAGDSIMAREMMAAMMHGTNHKMMMMESHGQMMHMMKDNPGMRHNMMSGMMEACKGDSVLMESMWATMMESCKSDTTMICQRYRAMMEACESDPAILSTDGETLPEAPQPEVTVPESGTKEIEGVDKTKLVLMKK